MALQNYFNMSQPVANPLANRDYNAEVQNSLDYFMNPNSDYMQQAKQQGLNLAAERGGINSSIAAGASQRSAIETAMPLAQQALGMQGQRDAAVSEDWLSSMNFSRQLQGQLAMAPLNSSMDMMSQLSQYALQDPELYTPAVMSGFSNFYNQNMNDILSRYFGG